MAARRALAVLPSSLRGLSSVAFHPAELQGVYNFGADSKANVIRAGEIGEVSGVPDEHLHRKVLIYSPARVASQQGVGKTGVWKISFESTQKWENPLMGWTSTGDPYHAVGEAALYFDTKEAAMEFASKYGWEYTIREPKQVIQRTKAYADNFKWRGPAEEEG
ncbi:NADH dehydrogenase (ubiquinone) Fe-S protein 4 [Marchantia polymorpha subsp. ruderalis]|uniref:NADH dehydrogenase [ubiquinone] iron-sulfur protein 4, mitochondrial n=2 Tax=Marchantia polymorpha TaxID=3197 RepID=A0A176WIV5_MARPO|nr:hypothetical protein AXG93_1865s1230 [Marchantia polymorpha subsp. ruderalis]PTQ34542.1 hypothetical protein MARPO_0079s0047 [Marchantia polymorpha]BBN20011.1 hypothetical protein Mp_8g15660 [Marchantia polymorpha subsp. ruderalis]|eukprot:PTQ34542.1 hypothetical protein MARPO_0079s0047 [Marchantia polymorpha]